MPYELELKGEDQELFQSIVGRTDHPETQYKLLNAALQEALEENARHRFQKLKQLLFRLHKANRAKLPRKPTITGIIVRPSEGDWDLTGLDFFKVAFSKNSYSKLNFRASSFKACTFGGCQIHSSNFGMAVFDQCSFRKCEFLSCNFRKCEFRDWNVDDSLFLNGDFLSASFRSVDMTNVSFGRSKGFLGDFAASFEGAVNLERARFTRKYDFCSWAILRTLGSLPLFGASYVGLIAIWIAVLIAKVVKEFGEPIVGDAEVALEISQMIAPPSLGWTFFALFLLAIASTLYRVLSPIEVQEYSETRWRFELEQPINKYRALSFRFPKLRWATFFAYLFSVPWLLYLLLFRCWETAAYFWS